jgi:hypothetical protein
VDAGTAIVGPRIQPELLFRLWSTGPRESLAGHYFIGLRGMVGFVLSPTPFFVRDL